VELENQRDNQVAAPPWDMPKLSPFVVGMFLVAACGGVGGGPDATEQPDAESSADACVPESDQALCARLAACGTVTADDSCGDPRTASCGGCGTGDACVDNACQAPACDSFAFPQQTLLTALNDPSAQDAPAAITPDGATMLLQRRSTCFGPFTLLIADNVGTANTLSDLSAVPGLQGLKLHEENNLTLTADGRTIVGVDTAGTGLLASTRSALGAVDFGAASPGDFAAIAVVAPSMLLGPALSPDGLALYYSIVNATDPATDGIYEAVRASTAVPFPAGTRMPAVVQGNGYVTATSSDRMTLFIQTNAFSMIVLSRTSLDAPFANPLAPAAPPTVPGFRTRPVGSCDRLVGTCTGGCVGEETCVFTM